MVFNIYGEKTYNDAEIYNGIRNNPELNNFFTSFTEYYTKKVESIKSEEMKKLEEKSPNLDELNDLISKIKKTGITISGEQWLFSSITENPWRSVNIGLPFPLIRFNDILLLEEEFEYFQTQDADSTKLLSKLERNYKQWKKDNKNIEKEIEKLQKRIIKNNSIANQFVKDQNQLYKFKERLKQGNLLKFKIDFIQNLTTEQKSLLGDLYKIYYKTAEEYLDFKTNKTSATHKIDEMIKNSISLVYDEFIGSRLVMIDIDLIIEKLFKVIMLSVLKEFKLQYTGESPTKLNTKLDGIKLEVVEWFVDQNSEKFKELFELSFQDVEFVTNTLVKKINSKI